MLYVVQKDSFRTPLAANHAAHHVKRRKVEKVVHATTTATATLVYRVFKHDMREIKHLLGYQKCTFKS